jgi:hypothetical protein
MGMTFLEEARSFFVLNSPAASEEKRAWFDYKHTVEDVKVAVDVTRDLYRTKPAAKVSSG